MGTVRVWGREDCAMAAMVAHWRGTLKSDQIGKTMGVKGHGSAGISRIERRTKVIEHD